MRKHNGSVLAAALSILAILITACGGGQQEPAAPTVPAATEEAPGTTEPAKESEQPEHKMPDGGTMPGHHHGMPAENPAK